MRPSPSVLLPDKFLERQETWNLCFSLGGAHTLADASEATNIGDWGPVRVRGDFDEGRASDALRRLKKSSPGQLIPNF